MLNDSICSRTGMLFWSISWYNAFCGNCGCRAWNILIGVMSLQGILGDANLVEFCTEIE